MALETILFLGLEKAGQSMIKAIGKTLLNRIMPPVEAARKSAVKRMAENLSDKFPSANFLEYNFRFDSLAAKGELEKLISQAEMPDESILKEEMRKETATQWPEYADRAEEIVDVFLKYFEIECLKNEALKFLTIASIIGKGATATQELIRECGEESKEGFRLLDKKLQSIESTLMTFKGTAQERTIERIASAIERRLVKERDEILDRTRKWDSKELYDKIEALSSEALELSHGISPEIAGSIYRLCASYNLRSFRDKEKGGYWVQHAEEAEPSNHKTIALKAELLCLEENWKDAYQILTPIAELSTEPIVKIIYVECLSHLSGPEKGFDWLSSQEQVKDDSEIRLNLASLAIRKGDFDYALDILDSLIEKPFPGPYPYLLKAEIHVNQAMPREAIFIATGDELELRKNPKQIRLAIDNLEKGIYLLGTAARSLEIPPHVNVLSELYIAIGDIQSAEKSLCKNWRILRTSSNAWFTASSIVFFKGKIKKVLARAQKALKHCKANDKGAMFRFALSCMNIQEWDKCLDAINSIPLEKLDIGELKVLLQIKIVCYFHKNTPEFVDENLKALRDQFPNDESYVVLQGLMQRQTGHLDQAIEIFSREIRTFPDSLKIKLQLASLYAEAKRHNDAFPLYREIAKSLNNARAYEEACVVGLYAQLPDEVISLVIEAEGNEILSEILKHFKAIALSMVMQYDKAYDLFSHFSEDSLTSNDYLFYSLSVDRKVNAEEAIKLLNKAKVKYPKDTRIIRSLCSLYIEKNAVDKAFQEARQWLELDKGDKGAYFAVILTGFASGEQEFAHRTLTDYLSIFGEGPELRSGTIEDVKRHLKNISKRSELLWEKYLAGQLPEAILAAEANLGLAGYRIELLNSPGRVMAFNGGSDFQKKCFVDSLTAKEVLVDYHGLITMHLLELIEPTIVLFGYINIPEVVFEKIREDLAELSLSFQKDRRKIKEETLLKIKSMFQIYEKFPQMNFKDIPEALGNSIYDLLICKEKKCVYVTPGFEQQEGETLKVSFQVDSMSVLDFITLMKEEGVINIVEYGKGVEILDKYRLKSLFKPERTPERALFDWNALEMLEECGVLGDVPRFIKECSVGPFSYTLLNSEIERYKRIDEIQGILRNIEDILRELLSKGICRRVVIAEPEKEIEKIPEKQKRAVKYLESIKIACSQGDVLLWTDDLLTSGLSVKSTCTRTMLDVLAHKKVISEEDYVQKLIQMVKWEMYFCWINANMMVKIAEMYSYSKGDDVMLVFRSLTNEIRGYLNHVPNEIEINTFNVASEVVKRLWLISDKAQSLGMEFFDNVLYAIGEKDILRRYWIIVSILNICLLGEMPLAEFLKRLSLRMPSQIEDELKISLRIFLELCLKGGMSDFIRITGKRIKAGVFIRAVKVSLPGYKDELIKLALDLDPTMRAII